MSSDIVRKEIQNLNAKKLSTYVSIPAPILKQCVDAYLPYLTVTINYSLTEKSLNVLRWSHYTRNWENYRRRITEQLAFCLVCQRSLRQSFTNNKIATGKTNYQNVWKVSENPPEPKICLPPWLKNAKKAIDKRECVSVLFLDLSKAFETINHGLLLAKVKAYGFSPKSLKLMHSYLNNRKQQVQINNKFSSESTVIAGFP